ncbi:MAG: NADH-quinone oxidoreductase subunit M [Propionibacteriaceae bacterium]|nr:NADH-quinone oxidoreductase subunit M [Propionibacteriaceae bacterium]
MPWLTVIGLLPLVGALVTTLVKGHSRVPIGFVFAAVTFGLSAWAIGARASLDESYTWIPQIGAHYALRMDGLSALLVIVTTFVTAIVILTRWKTQRWFNLPPLALALESAALFTYLANDILIFFIAFEVTLIPMYFLIASGGKPKRSAAALKFLLFSLAGGLVLLGGVIYVMAIAPSGLSFSDLSGLAMTPGAEKVLFLVFFVAFAFKSPLVPLHPWLPDAVEQARPAASVLLVGVLDGIGLYGMVRFCVGITPGGATWAAYGIEIAALVTVVYGAFAAIASRSLMRMAAFTSISHAGFMVLGLFAFTSASVSGAMTYVAAHALSATALILAAGWAVKRRGDDLTKGAFGGLARRAPVLAGVFLVSGLATLALPGTANFAAELSIIIGAWGRHPVLVAVALLAVLGAGVYVMWAYQRVFTGAADVAVDEMQPEGAPQLGDIRPTSRWAAGLALVGVIAFGVFPGAIQNLVSDTATQTMSVAQMSDPEGGR